MPRSVPGTVVISTRVTEATSARIDLVRGGTSRARWFADLVHKALDQANTEPEAGAPVTGHFWGHVIAKRILNGHTQHRYSCTRCDAMSEWLDPGQREAKSAVVHAGTPLPVPKTLGSDYSDVTF